MPIFSSVENLPVVHRLARAAVLLACAGAFSAGAQTLLPSITSGISPARGASLTNVVIPRAVAPVAQAGTAATAAATDATGLSGAPLTGRYPAPLIFNTLAALLQGPVSCAEPARIVSSSLHRV